MAWRQIGYPVVQQQRGQWVVRVTGIDTETGRRRPRQLGTFRSRRTAEAAAREFAAAREIGSSRETVGSVVDRWVADRTDISTKTRGQYEWAAGRIKKALGRTPIGRLDRDDVVSWVGELANDGELSKRSIQIVLMVLRAALDEAVDVGDLSRNPAANVDAPRRVAKLSPSREGQVWSAAEVQQFLETSAEHRWGAPLRLAVHYGLRRSELLGLRWSAVDLTAGTVRIERALVDVGGGSEWSDGKNTRARRTIRIGSAAVAALVEHQRFQAEERLLAGRRWVDNDLVVTTRTGTPVSASHFDSTLQRLIANAQVPRLTSNGLRRTAASHMLAKATDVGELDLIAYILGHTTSTLLNTYAQALPETMQTVVDRIEGQDSSDASH